MAAATRNCRFSVCCPGPSVRPVGAHLPAAGDPVGVGEIKPGAAKRPFITVAIPTCNRPADVTRCLASLAAVRYPSWQVLLIDQSDGDETRFVAQAWEAVIPKIVYLRLETKNASEARNVAIENAAGDILAFVDDDCTVPPDWLHRVTAAFEYQQRASLIFGSVTAAEHDPEAEFVPVNELEQEQRVFRSRDIRRLNAMGANMSVRLESQKPPPFDPLLGPGGRFRSSQDLDYAFRVIASGRTVVVTPRIVVTHHGAHPYAGGAAGAKLRDSLYGVGACHAKLLRCGEWVMAGVIMHNLATSVAAVRPLNPFLGRPTRLGLLLAYVRGLVAGSRIPVDRPTGLFRATA
jgi:glycosyl transferase family 2